MPAFYQRWLYRGKQRIIGHLLGKPQPRPMTYIGPGSAMQLGKSIAQFGVRNLLVVTDKPLRDLGILRSKSVY